MKYFRNHIVIIFFISIMLSGCEKIFEEQPENNPEAVFENLWHTFYEEYAPFEERNVSWESAYNKYRPLVGPNTSEDELFDILSDLLAILDDGNVILIAPDREIFYSSRIRREKTDDELFNRSVVKNNYLETGFEESSDESYIYGKIRDENIGYIYFDYVGVSFLELDDFLTQYESAAGIIIDLRHNQSGDFTFCFSEIGRLVDKTRFVFRSKTKNGSGKNDYTAWKEWNINPSGNYINKPVMVLIDRYTIGAGERSVMVFKALPNVTLIGDTTNGAHGIMIGRELANGWYYSLDPQKVEMPDGKSYEGIGIAPDINVKNDISDIDSGTDKVIQSAIDEIKLKARKK
ncbi:MAG: S41 family peptidase [Bacteroidales bacterium]|nr:S41 family peptidase [Bacteroidales bacterium]